MDRLAASRTESILPPVWIAERAVDAVRARAGEDLLLAAPQHLARWRSRVAAPERPLFLPAWPRCAVDRLGMVMDIVAGIATDLVDWVDRSSPGDRSFAGQGAAPVDPSGVVPTAAPAGCPPEDWMEVRRCLLWGGLPRDQPIEPLMALRWGPPARWPPSRRRALRTAERYRRVLAGLDDVASARRSLVSQELLWRQEWRELLAPLTERPPAGQRGGPRLRPSRVPRYLAAWLLREEGFRSQAIGYLLAFFGLAEAEWALSHVKVARRLNTTAVRALAFWKRLAAEQVGRAGAPGGSQADPGAAPRHLLDRFLRRAWDLATPVAAFPDLRRAGIGLPGGSDRARPAPPGEPGEPGRQPGVVGPLGVFLEDLAMRRSIDLRLDRPDAHAGRFQQLLSQRRGPLPAPCAPGDAVDAAAWVLDVMPGWCRRVRQGPLAPEARGWHPCNPDDLLPLRAPPGIEDPPWQAARRLLVDDASEDAASFALRVAKSQGWEGGAGRMPRPLQMLLCVAIPYRNIVDSVRRETLAARDELLLDEAWNRAWRCCFWPMGLGASGLVHVATASRRRNAAPVHLAAWLLARGGFSRTLVGGVLVHLGAASVSVSRQTARLAEIATREEHAGSADLVDLLQDQSGPPLLAWSRLEKARRLAGVEGGQERSAPEELFTALQEAWLAEWQMR